MRDFHSSIFTWALLILLLIKLLTGSSFAQTGVPYSNNFEGPNATTGWSHYATTGVDDWELGDPSGAYFNSAYSGDSAWVTMLNGTFAQNSIRYLETPEFDLTNTSVNYALSFQHKRNNYNTSTEFILEYSTDGGISWNILFNSGASSKYWQNATTGFYNLNNQYSWKESVYELSWLQGQNVSFRFKVNSSNAGGDGWIIDDFKIEEEYYNVTATQSDTIKGINQYFSEFDLVYDFNFANQYTDSYPFQTDFYFSQDSILDGGDQLLGSTNFNAISSGIGLTETLPLPAGLSSGDYFVIYEFDVTNNLLEANENDNINFAVIRLDSVYVGKYKTSFDTLQNSWTTTSLSPQYNWNIGDPNNWHVEQPRTGDNGAYSPANTDTYNTQYLESPYIDLSSTTNTSVCLWYRNSKVQPNDLSVGIQIAQAGQTAITYPYFVSAMELTKPRLYTWDCYCRNISQLDGEQSTKIRLYGGGNNTPTNLDETLIDDIYIGEAKPDVAIESHKSNRFTGVATTQDTLTYLLFNSGLSPMPSNTTKFYWSTDSILDGTDILLGSKSEPSLMDTSYSWEKFIYSKPTTAIGQYFIIYQADANFDVDEMREEDNEGYFKIYQDSVHSLPYFNDFENQIAGWRHGSTLGADEWEWGVPSGVYLDSAFSGTKAFATNLSGSSQNDSRMHLYTPIFDLSQLSNPVLEFDMMNVFYGVNGYNYWPFNMGNLMYSTDGGANWEVLDSTNLSFKRLYYRMEYESISGQDRLPINGSAVSHGELLYGKNLEMFRNHFEYQTRDYDDNSHYVVDLEFIGDAKQVQFMFVYGNHNSIMEGMMLDNFEITEARIDLKVFTNKNLLVDKDDERLKFYFKVANDENYISDSTFVNIYCTVDTVPNSLDTLIHTEKVEIIRPFYKDLIIIDRPTPANYGDFNYVKLEIDPGNLNVESNETNNIHYLSLNMDSCENYSYPVIFDFEDDYIDGWTWYHDSTGWLHHQRFRHQAVIKDPVVGVQSGEWFLDGFDLQGYSNSYSQYPIHMLESPAFDFSSLADIQLIFDFMCIGNNYPSQSQGGNIEYSVDGGATWNVLTTAQDPNAQNWYNLSQVQSLNGEPGWGNLTGSPIWHSAQFNLSFLSGEPNVRFRFKYRSDEQSSNNSPHGFRMDNFNITGYDADLKTDFYHVQVNADISQPSFSVTYDIINNSDSQIFSSNTKMYWSDDSIFDASDQLLYDIPEAILAPNSTFSNLYNVYYPIPIIQQTYYLFYVIDANDDVIEANENNNVGSFEISFNGTSYVDLVATPISNPVFTSAGQGFFPFEYYFENIGTISSGSTVTELLWSPDSTYDTTDMTLYSFSEVMMSPLSSEYRSGDIYFPGPITQQDYYLLINVDQQNDVNESDELNNLTAVRISFDDLNNEDWSNSDINIRQVENGILFTNLTADQNGNKYAIYNPMGQLIQSGKLENINNNSVLIKLDQTATGVYLITLIETGVKLKFFYHD